MTTKLPAVLRPEPGEGSLKATPWAGTRLGPLRGRPAERIGESWEFSTIPGSESRALGRPLDEVLGGPLPFLAKLIDTDRALSIQVHPADDPVRGLLGKEEAWVILAAEPGADVLVGVRPGLERDAFAATVRRVVADPSQGTALIDSIARVEVEVGMCILVPAGTVHAIGPGVLLAEIQQPNPLTYRLFDYGSGRELHVDDALEATSLPIQPPMWRPQDPPRALVGEHIRLEPVMGGSRDLGEGSLPTLVVAVRGTVTVAGELLAPGDLRLCVGPAQLGVATDGLAVIGTCTS